MAKTNTQRNDTVALVQQFKAMADLQAARKSEETWTPGKKRSGYNLVKGSATIDMQRHSSEEDEDRFSNIYTIYGLLEPPYKPSDQWRIYEECDTLMLCITSLVNNIERPHTWEWRGENDKDKLLAPNIASRIRLDDFFRRINERESFLDLRKKVRRDRSVTGNAYVEVLRNPDRFPERLYYIPSTHMRVTTLDKEFTDVSVTLPREGKLIEVTVPRRLRRFCRWDRGAADVIWFKELGDPRVVDFRTGEYVKNEDGTQMMDADSDYPNKATEIWWVRDVFAGNAYGIPFWTPALWAIRGRYLSGWINYDHLDGGAIPPFAFCPTGGKISETSRKEFERALEQMRDPAYYNRIPILTIEPDLNFDLNRGTSALQTRLEVVKLRDPHHEDFMFSRYSADTEETIRKTSLLPPLYIGNVKNYSNATAYSSMEVAESQVFQPARDEFDEQVNVLFVQNEFKVNNWEFKSMPSKIGDKETFYRSVRIWGTVGGPSMNQLISLGNEVFGTSWNQLEGTLYNLPASIVMALTNGGQTTINDKGEFVMAQQAPAPPENGNPFKKRLPPVTPNEPGLSDGGVKDDELERIFIERENDAAAILDIMARIEKRGYSPEEIKEESNAI